MRHRPGPHPHASAVPAAGGDAYSLTGSKIFISAGEHDLTENIVHLVLAKLPDAPPGIKGISLFVVPKFMPADTMVPQCNVRLRLDRAQDGHQGLAHLRDQLR